MYIREKIYALIAVIADDFAGLLKIEVTDPSNPELASSINIKNVTSVSTL